MIPKLPIDFNSDSAFETLKFITDHYEDLMLAYKDIMEHLKLPVLGGGGESLHEVISVTNLRPLYLTFRFVTNPPASPSANLLYGTTGYPVDSAYINSLVGVSAGSYLMPYDSDYEYQLRLFQNGVEVDYNEVNVRYEDDAPYWEPYTLKLYKVERYSADPTIEDLGDFITAYQTLMTSEEAIEKPTDDELFRALDVDGYLVSKTDIPYTYAVDTQLYDDVSYSIKGGTFSTGWISTMNSHLYLPSGGCSAVQLGNHYYIDVYVGLVGSYGDQVITFDTYIKSVTDDDTPHTFNYLVSKNKIDNRR